MTKNLPTVKETSKPADITYATFDDFVLLSDKLVALDQQIDKACRNGDAKKYLERIRSPQIRNEVARLKKWQAHFDREELYDNIDGVQMGTKHSVISDQIAFLIGSVPIKPDAPQIFGPAMINDVHAARPNACVLESACREVRRTQERLSIPKVLAAIKKHEPLWEARLYLAGDMGVTPDEIISDWESRLVHCLDTANKEPAAEPQARITAEKPMPVPVIPKRKVQVDFSDLDIPDHEYPGEEEE